MSLLTERTDFSAEELGLPAHSVFRCPCELPDGRVAIGSDYGLVLMTGDRVESFPFPAGARRECKDIQALAWAEGELHVASAKNAYRWDGKGPVRARSFPLDGKGGFEELRTVYAGPNGLIEAWRTRWVCGEETQAAEDILCLARSGDRVFYGSRSGRLGLLSGELIHEFPDEPVRHLAWAHEKLWIASNGGLHTWTSELKQVGSPEPFGLSVDAKGRLWTLDARGLSLSQTGEPPERLNAAISQPWAIGSSSEHLWVGRRGGVVRWRV